MLSTFVPLNTNDDPLVTKKELEEELSRELEVEQAFASLKNTLLLHKEKKLIEAYSEYQRLFDLAVLSNHYSEEEYSIRGIQAGDSPDGLVFLAPNVKSLRHLAFRNRGLLYLSILKTGQCCQIAELKTHESPKASLALTDSPIPPIQTQKDLFYTAIDDLCISLVYHEGDEQLLLVLTEIFIYLGDYRLARFALEYLVSANQESDVFSGSTPVSKRSKAYLKFIKSKLCFGPGGSNLLPDLATKYDYLALIREDYQQQIIASSQLHKEVVNVDSRSCQWVKIFQCLADATSKRQDIERLQDASRTTLKNLDPYLLCEEPIERMRFHIDMFSVDAPSRPEPENPPPDDQAAQLTENSSSQTVENVETLAPLESVDLQPLVSNGDKTEATKTTAVIQRSSKRLAKAETEVSQVEIERGFFEETRKFFDTLNLQIAELGCEKIIPLVDITKVYVPEGPDTVDALLYVKDFIRIVNNWLPQQHSTALLVGDDSNKSNDDEKLKVLTVLDGFGNASPLNKADKYADLPELSSYDSAANALRFASEINDLDMHFQHVRAHLLTHMLRYTPIESTDGRELQVCFFTDTRWSDELIRHVRECVLQTENALLQDISLSGIQDFTHVLALSIGVFEVLLDVFISLKNKIWNLVSKSAVGSGQKYNKASVNTLGIEALKLDDKLVKWSRFIENVFNDCAETVAEHHVLQTLSFRYRWCVINREKARNSNCMENKYLISLLENLLDDVTRTSPELSVRHPNSDNLIEISVESIKSQLTTTSVLAIFSKIIYTDNNDDNADSALVLHHILIDKPSLAGDPVSGGINDRNSADNDVASHHNAIVSIREFLTQSPVDMKLSLWRILFLYYRAAGDVIGSQKSFANALVFIFNYLCGPDYDNLPESSRSRTLLRMIAFYDEISSNFICELSKTQWRMESSAINDEELLNMFNIASRLFEFFYLFSIHEEAALITSLKVSVLAKSEKSYSKLKDTFIGTVALFTVLYREILIRSESPGAGVTSFVSTVHHQMGIRNLCGAGGGLFLRMAYEVIVNEETRLCPELVQLIACRYHHNVSLEGMSASNHNLEHEDELDIAAVNVISGFILPLCLRTNPFSNPPKHDTRSFIEAMYEVVGDPDFDSGGKVGQNFSSLEFFLDSTRITSRFTRDAFYGLLKTDISHDEGTSQAVSNGIYYLHGLFMFNSYKARKKNMQSRLVELEHIISLLKSDLVFHPLRVESWYLLAQALSFLVEDDLIWTADKLTIPEKKIGTANIQRQALVSYLMAINATLRGDTARRADFLRPIIPRLMYCFATEMYNACMTPMNMHAFKVQTPPRLVRGENGVTFESASANSLIPLKTCLKLMQQSLRLASKANPTSWLNHYYLAKVQHKLKMNPREVLALLLKSANLASKESVGGEPILEPHYLVCSLIYKYVKQDLISMEDALTILRSDPIIHSEGKEANNKLEFYKLLALALRRIISHDKKKWHHKPCFLLAKILAIELDQALEALQVMSSFVSLKNTNKMLVLIWKPDNERPGKHFVYTYQYASLYIKLLAQTNNFSGLSQMIPKLRRASPTMININAAWDNLCSSICKMVRLVCNVSDSFDYTDTFLLTTLFAVFAQRAKTMVSTLLEKGIPDDLKGYICILHSLNDLRKTNMGFGPTSLIDDTSVVVYVQIYSNVVFNTDALLLSSVGDSVSDLPSAKSKRVAKRDVFPFASDISKNLRREIDTIFRESPDVQNEFIKKKLTEHASRAAEMRERTATPSKATTPVPVLQVSDSTTPTPSRNPIIMPDPALNTPCSQSTVEFKDQHAAAAIQPPNDSLSAKIQRLPSASGIEMKKEESSVNPINSDHKDPLDTSCSLDIVQLLKKCPVSLEGAASDPIDLTASVTPDSGTPSPTSTVKENLPLARCSPMTSTNGIACVSVPASFHPEYVAEAMAGEHVYESSSRDNELHAPAPNTLPGVSGAIGDAVKDTLIIFVPKTEPVTSDLAGIPLLNLSDDTRITSTEEALDKSTEQLQTTSTEKVQLHVSGYMPITLTGRAAISLLGNISSPDSPVNTMHNQPARRSLRSRPHSQTHNADEVIVGERAEFDFDQSNGAAKLSEPGIDSKPEAPDAAFADSDQKPNQDLFGSSAIGSSSSEQGQASYGEKSSHIDYVLLGDQADPNARLGNSDPISPSTERHQEAPLAHVEQDTEPSGNTNPDDVTSRKRSLSIGSTENLGNDRKLRTKIQSNGNSSQNVVASSEPEI